jgi:hypothetical protein
MEAKELIMDLTKEQGQGRETQVQPPKEVWEQFFEFRLTDTARPTFRLKDAQNNSAPEQRKVVKHHHNFTLEIAGAKPPRPAIIRMRRIGINSFEYWVYRPRTKDYLHWDWLLENVAATESGRRWLVIWK